MFSEFSGLDLSHKGVKWVVGWFIGFVFTIASALCHFFYLKSMNTWYKNIEKSLLW